MSSRHDDPSRDPVFGAPLCVPGWQVRLATTADLPAIAALRARAFRGDPAARDLDDFDSDSLHLWVGRTGAGRGADPGLRATLRLRVHRTAEALLSGYAAQFYDLSALARAPGPVVELGRLCRAPDAGGAQPDGDGLRLVWGGVARIVLNSRAARLIGCTSFATTTPVTLAPALNLLAARYLGPESLRPAIKAPRVHRLETSPRPLDPAAPGLLPPLLRQYLALGGWVSDHLVIDRDLGTSHVFTCVDIATMPQARKRVLTRLSAGQG
jgi:putative hemolysin